MLTIGNAAFEDSLAIHVDYDDFYIFKTIAVKFVVGGYDLIFLWFIL